MYKLNRYLVLAVAALLACACVFASAQDQDAPADTESNSDSTMDASSDADWDVDSNFADTPSLATTGPATTQGASTQPTTLPSRPLIQAKADDLFANALFGRWNNDIGIGNIHLSLRPDYRFRLSRVVGTFRVHGNSIVLRTQGGQATYQFRFDGKLLVLSGGDLRQEIRFTRQSNVNDSLSSLFEPLCANSVPLQIVVKLSLQPSYQLTLKQVVRKPSENNATNCNEDQNASNSKLILHIRITT